MHAQRSFLVRQRSTKIPADRIRHYVIIFLRIVVQRVLVVQMIGQRATEFVSEKRRTHSLSRFLFPSGENFQENILKVSFFGTITTLYIAERSYFLSF